MTSFSINKWYVKKEKNYKNIEACLAQLAERKTEDLEVAGSTPAAGSIFFHLYLCTYLISIFNEEVKIYSKVIANIKYDWIFDFTACSNGFF